VSPGSIAVLHSSAPNFGWPLHNGLIGGYPAVRAEHLDDQAIVVDKIGGFKGLERSAVLLIATPECTREVCR
jgi:hypothetical protein